MTKVLHFVTDYPGSLSVTTTLAVKNLIDKTASEIEHHVVMVDRERGFFCRKLSNGQYHLGLPRFKYGILNTTFSFLIFLIFIAKYDIWKKVDVVHCHKLTIDGVFGLFSKLLLGLPYVISVRGASDEKWLRKKFYARIIYKAVILKSEHIFFVSAFMKGVISDIYGDIIYHSSNLPNISGCAFNKVAESAQWSDKILFVGRLNIWRLKGLDKVIEAIAANPNISLDIIGDGEQYRQDILKYAEHAGCAQRISFVGALPNDEVKRRLWQYACLVMPSYPETFGMVYVEALNAGLPVICSQRAGLSGYLENKPYVQSVDETSINSISSATERLYNNQLDVKLTLSNEFEFLHSIFSDEAIVAHYLQSFDELKGKQ